MTRKKLKEEEKKKYVATEGCAPSIRRHVVTIATCNLNQWALDFDGNLERVRESIIQAKAKGATYRVGPELELCGYGCEDHFLEQDTYMHSDESLAALLKEGVTDGILCDIGAPVEHMGARFNCRIFCLNGQILLIRPKTYLANDGNYREGRYFTSWKRRGGVESHRLSPILATASGQAVVPFGQGGIFTADTFVACEVCEELWAPNSSAVDQFLAGAEIIGNGSASHHCLRKHNERVDLIVTATRKCGGIYAYANQRGCDGGRLYYDGGAVIVCNGKVLAQASQFCLRDIEVVTATVDLDEVRAFRSQRSSCMEQMSEAPRIHMVQQHDFWLTMGPRKDKTVAQKLIVYSPMEECALGPACWLWDYIRRSGAAGFFLPLSGGADSAAVATIVGIMCDMALKEAKIGKQKDTEKIIRRLCALQPNAPLPSSPSVVVNSILHTAYLGSENSSENTYNRALKLAENIGAYHLTTRIDTAVNAVVSIVSTCLGGRTPRFSCAGGSLAEDLCLQNTQARIRMVMSYIFAQLLPWVRNRPGFLLVLSASNVDESLRGYLTKYDCSSADLNPIGSISKLDLKQMLEWACEEYCYSSLKDIIAAPPTAELRPTTKQSNPDGESTQLDEEEMGMTYNELSHFGRLRKVYFCGPFSMVRALCEEWGTKMAISEVAMKVKRFFVYYGINRHKQTTLTPSYFAEPYSPDDNRYDLRPFLYPSAWSRQFRDIDAFVSEEER